MVYASMGPRATGLLSQTLRLSIAANASRLPVAARRCKSGPYGYTQAKALVFSKYGEPSDVLKLHTHSISPSISQSSILVRSLAAPINPADINTIQGTYGSKPTFASLIGTAEPSVTPGNEGVFEVVSVGSASRTWRTHAVATNLNFSHARGKSATTLARALGDGGTLVSYGGMSRQPVSLPVGLLIFKDIRFVGFWLSGWNERDAVGKKHMVDDILDMMRQGKFTDVPIEEVPWSWDTQEKQLREAVQSGLTGFRSGKGVFLFGET
ncbi:hypothetical protein LMH87_002240 [Akanthomyces muscarius]|uniref:Uncharacterized protein n=1 Tax=Akanthomyces muscarius TaxID=2231603 RepID=A0A9W8Q6G2_AKAMU|nr:hypothetical protein LMH87_002240 [Akanthomyces muscarius]KAJ4147733.1 hypothetical protein LMH87_002240 [Akanthomyces muscarius]